MAADSAVGQEVVFPTTPIVTTDRCVIRPYVESDADAMTVAANHPNIVRYMRNTFPHPYTLDIARNFINNIANAQTPCVDFAVCLPDGTYVGGVGLKPG